MSISGTDQWSTPVSLQPIARQRRSLLAEQRKLSGDIIQILGKNRTARAVPLQFENDCDRQLACLSRVRAGKDSDWNAKEQFVASYQLCDPASRILTWECRRCCPQVVEVVQISR
jgi:hypothetical protein